MPADILLYAVIAAGLVFWLRSILGTRHGDERGPSNFNISIDKAADQKADQNKANNTAFTDTQTAPPGFDDPLAEASMTKSLERNMSVNDTALPGLKTIHDKDRAFDLPFFMKAVQDAFIFIVEAFSEGDKDTLKDLLSENVYKGFEGAIDDRKAKGYESELEIHSVRKIELINAWTQGKMAYMTIRFVADETRVLRDSEGTVLQGNPDRITETIDIWTFGRQIKSKNPAWILYETRDEDAADSEFKTVPDHDDAKVEKADKASDTDSAKDQDTAKD